MRVGFMPGRCSTTALGRIVRSLVLALLLIAAPGAIGLGVENRGAPQPGSSEVVFLSQILLLLVCGRLLGEVMLRIGQPAVMGQLIAGLLLGPSVLGVLWPELQQAIFASG